MAGEYQKDHVRELSCIAEELELEGRTFLRCFSVEELAREYNGIGPEWIGAEVRAKTTKYLSLFEPAALIHDLRNYMSDGTREAFAFANKEFLANCLKLANDRYSWWDPRLYRARAVARLLYAFVQGQGGWRAWLDCFNKNQNKKGKMK